MNDLRNVMMRRAMTRPRPAYNTTDLTQNLPTQWGANPPSQEGSGIYPQLSPIAQAAAQNGYGAGIEKPQFPISNESALPGVMTRPQVPVSSGVMTRPRPDGGLRFDDPILRLLGGDGNGDGGPNLFTGDRGGNDTPSNGGYGLPMTPPSYGQSSLVYNPYDASQAMQNGNPKKPVYNPNAPQTLNGNLPPTPFK